MCFGHRATLPYGFGDAADRIIVWLMNSSTCASCALSITCSSGDDSSSSTLSVTPLNWGAIIIVPVESALWPAAQQRRQAQRQHQTHQWVINDSWCISSSSLQNTSTIIIIHYIIQTHTPQNKPTLILIYYIKEVHLLKCYNFNIKLWLNDLSHFDSLNIIKLIKCYKNLHNKIL